MKLNRMMIAMGFSVAMAAAQGAEWAPTSAPLMTRWAKEVTPENAWQVYPRPQLEREKWQNLNGLWDLAVRENAFAEEKKYDKKILVPFAVESALSGVGERANHLHYRRTFTVPADWKDQRVLLNFEAVDWQTSVTVNGQLLKTLGGNEIHQGGYDRFSYDITDVLKDGENTVEVSVFDPTEKGDQPRGKQVTKSHGIWYTPTTGIWQTVWLEPVSPKGFIRNVKLTPDPDFSEKWAKLKVEVDVAGIGQSSGSGPFADGNLFVTLKGARGQFSKLVPIGQEIELEIPKSSVELWSPDSPTLYDVSVELRRPKDQTNAGELETVDTINSYTGFRTIEIKKVGDFQRIFLNGKQIFQSGPLDQGYWPDGIMTAPTPEALVWDIDYARELGFNMIRKHIKVEPDIWYHHCDKIGMLVWQDSVNGVMQSPESKKQFEKDQERMIEELWNSPSIVLWVVFNEGWGQFDTERITKKVMEMDPTRLVTNASGWVDKNVGHILDMHKYPGPGAPDPDPTRASVLGEFGGLGLFVEGHAWADKTWGYQGMDTQEELYERFKGVMDGLRFLRATRGLCASVYTQTTDVEIEANGIVTYDREFKKIPSDKVKAINDSIINLGELREVAPTALNKPDTQWQYTTDKPGDDWAKTDFDASGWKTDVAGFGNTTKRIFGPVGTTWTTENIWLRRSFDLPADVKPEHVQMILVHVDDAEVFINGVKAGEFDEFITGYEPRELTAEAKAALKPGEKNVIAVHCKHIPDEGEKQDIGQYIDVGLIEETPAKP